MKKILWIAIIVIIVLGTVAYFATSKYHFMKEDITTPAIQAIETQTGELPQSELPQVLEQTEVEEKQFVIQKIEAITGIIENIEDITRYGRTGSMDKCSDIIYNLEKKLGLYILCYTSGYPDGTLTRTDNIGALLEYNTKTYTNTVLFLGDGGWYGGFYYLPTLKYNFQGDIIIDDIILIPKDNSNVLIQSNRWEQDVLYNPAPEFISSTVPLKKNGSYSNPDEEGYGVNYLSIGCGGYDSCGVSFHGTKIEYIFMRNRTSNSSEFIKIAIPYYTFEEDLNTLVNTEIFKQIGEEIPKEWDEERKYLQSLDKNSFKIMLSMTEMNNGEETILSTGDILILHNINPQTVSFEFFKDKNIQHSYMRVIGLTSPTINGLFLFNMQTLQGTRIENYTDFAGRQNETTLLLQDTTIDINSLQRQNQIEK